MKEDILMRIKKSLRILTAGLLTAFALVVTGAVSTGADVVKAAGGATVTSCVINGGNVAVTASVSATSEDGQLYLFAEPIYSDGISTEPVATAPAGATAAFTTPLNANQANSRLYAKFIVAAKQGGSFVPLNTGAYITNPEAIASHSFPRNNAGKKGLLINPDYLNTDEYTNLGVKQAIYNIPLSNIIGPTTNGMYPTINYNYNGKTYQFNGLVVAEYDHVFGNLTNKGIAVTATLLNNSNGRAPHMIHPLSRGGHACPYYAFNVAEQAGVEQLEATAAFLAERYSGGHGKVQNWIVGNEVTARLEWNYINIQDINAYVNEYAEAYRLIYNSIKSKNANANIYICIDQQWDRNRNEVGKYDSKDLINVFNANITAGGNIDWGLAVHPMPVPLTWAAYWTGGAYYKNLVKHNENSPYVTMENIEVTTDYMCKPELLSPNGQVRSIIASEVGYTSGQGEQMQAAAFAHGYMQAANNQHIDAFLLSRQTDDPQEIAQGLPFGIENADRSHKLVYDYYKNIDTANAASYLEQAKAIMGIADWSQVLTAR